MRCGGLPAVMCGGPWWLNASPSCPRRVRASNHRETPYFFALAPSLPSVTTRHDARNPAMSNGANLVPRDMKMRTAAVKRSAAAATSLCWAAVLLVAPIANAVPLGNGLDIECFLDNTTNHVKCVTMPGCPRVHGDYVVDALHVMINGHQDEYPYHCINGQTVSWGLGIDPNSTFTIGVQACRKKDLE